MIAEERYADQRSGRKRRRRRRVRRRRVLFVGLCMLLAFGVFRSGALFTLPLRLNGCPQSLVELAERNLEARPFALHYHPGVGQEESIDLSSEVKKGTIPLFLQWDERWGYQTYGSDYLAVTGCGPTSLAMVYCGLTGDPGWNPGRLAAWAADAGYYVDGVGTAWSLMTDGAARLGLHASEVPVTADALTATLQNGHPIICSVGPGDFTGSGHFIVLTGLNGAGKVTVHDPNSRRRSRQGWEPERLTGQIKQMWSYTL